MNHNMEISLIVALVTAGIGVMALWRDPRSFVHRVFALGMVLFALEAGLTGFVYPTLFFDSFFFWQRMQLIVASFLPALWLLFSVSFARANYAEQISRWKWVLVLSLVLPLSLVTLFNAAFFAGPPILTDKSTLFLHIGWSGYLWHLLWVILGKDVPPCHRPHALADKVHVPGHRGDLCGSPVHGQSDRPFQGRQYRPGYC
jgi:uncharacterized membrane protein